MKQTNLIIGCGYLGRRLLKVLHGERNYVVNRFEQKKAIDAANDNHQIISNINDRQSWHSLDALSEEQSIRIYFKLTDIRQIISNIIDAATIEVI